MLEAAVTVGAGEVTRVDAAPSGRRAVPGVRRLGLGLGLAAATVLGALAGCGGPGEGSAGASGASSLPTPLPTSAAASGSTGSPLPPDTYPVGAGTVYLGCRGTGSPAVLLLAGGRDPHTDWDDLVVRLGPQVRTCAFDYPGVGGSSAVAGAMTPQRVSDALAGVLDAAQVAPPYVVVGHSLAGLSVREYVGQHGDDVAGVVLFDGTPLEIVEAYPADLERQNGWDPAATIAQLRQVTSWPDVPVRILQSDPDRAAADGQTPEVAAIWRRGQVALAALAPDGTVQLVPGAGHFIFQDDPTVAVETIREVLAAAR